MSFWKKLFNKEKIENRNHDAHNLDWLVGDMHNHILPGIDDGSPSVEQSIHLIKGLKALGIHQAIATPHVMQGVHKNTPETISSAHAQLSKALKEQEIDFKLGYSAEYMIDEELETWISTDQICPLPNKYMLIEMSYLSESKSLFKTIQDIQNKGLKPILAHPERYNYYHHNFQMYKDIKNAGCLLQLNMLSISRYYGDPVKNTALMMIKAGMYDFVGTDLHHDKHLSGLNRIVNKYDVKDLLKYCTLQNERLF